MAVALWAMGSDGSTDSTCISHTTAAWLHGLQSQPETIHVTAARALQARKGITPHRMVVDVVDVTTAGPIPTTSAARTLLDIGSVCDIDLVESALESALRRGLVSIPRLEWQLSRCGGRGRRGAKTLRALLEDRARGYIPSESELELRLYRLLKKARLPLPSRQKVFKDQGRFIARVDYAYADSALVIEVHGWRYHSQRSRWERDQARSRALVLSGQRVLVFNWNEVTKEPSMVATEVARALGVEQLF